MKLFSYQNGTPRIMMTLQPLIRRSFSFFIVLLSFNVIIFVDATTTITNNSSINVFLSNRNSTKISSTSGNVQQQQQQNSRIVGGTIANVGTYPAYGIAAGDKLCGATLIHSDIMITAAHCYGIFRMNNTQSGVSGVYIRTKDLYGTNSIHRIVEREVPHPQYNSYSLQNDIMILKLSNPVWDVPKQKLNYNTHKWYDPTEKVKVIGFGATGEGEPLSNELRQVTINVIDFTFCVHYWWFSPARLSNKLQICAGDIKYGQKDSCYGDSGGPLFDPSTNEQIGIVSFGPKCAQKNAAPVYTRISGYRTYIEKQICNLSSFKPKYCII